MQRQWGDFIVGGELGVGLTASVHLAERAGVPYALKRFPTSRFLHSSPELRGRMIDSAQGEYAALGALHHPHILRAAPPPHGSFVHEDDVCIALECVFFLR